MLAQFEERKVLFQRAEQAVEENTNEIGKVDEQLASLQEASDHC